MDSIDQMKSTFARGDCIQDSCLFSQMLNLKSGFSTSFKSSICRDVNESFKDLLLAGAGHIGSARNHITATSNSDCLVIISCKDTNEVTFQRRHTKQPFLQNENLLIL